MTLLVSCDLSGILQHRGPAVGLKKLVKLHLSRYYSSCMCTHVAGRTGSDLSESSFGVEAAEFATWDSVGRMDLCRGQFI